MLTIEMNKLSSLLCFILLTPLQVFPTETAIKGYWLTSESIVAIKPCGVELCAKIEHVFVVEGVDPKSILDSNNRDLEKRSRPLIGIDLLHGFSRQLDSSNSVKGGRIYNPRDGRSYKAKLQLHDDGNLTVQGCFLFFCDGETWRPLMVTINPDGTHTAVVKNTVEYPE
jgi:uncharacterized protein (DUF2147 family)